MTEKCVEESIASNEEIQNILEALVTEPGFESEDITDGESDSLQHQFPQESQST